MTAYAATVVRRAVGVLFATAALSVAAGPSAVAQTLTERFDAMLAGAQQPRDPLAAFYLSEAQLLAPQVADGLARLTVVATRLAARSRAPWLAGEARGALAGAVAPTNPIAARAHAEAAGVLASGAVLGPFAGAGAGQAPPHPYDATWVADGARGPIGWRPYAHATLTGRLQLADLLGSVGGDAHAFVTVALDVPRATDVMVVVGSNGPVTAWLDGVEALSWEGERTLSDWQHAVPRRLAAGTHHLTVRAGHATEPPELMLRLIDRRGLLPRGITVRAPRADDVLATSGASRKLPPALGPDPAQSLAVRARLALLVERDEPAKRTAAELIEQALDAAPGDSELYYLLGRAEQSDVSRARAAYETAGDEHAAALGALVMVHREHQLDADADELARTLASLDPDHPVAIAHDAWRLREHADAGAALTRLKAAEARPTYPRDSARLVLQRASLLDQSGRTLAAREAWAAVARIRGAGFEAVRRSSLAARDAGDTSGALAVLDDALQRRPYALEIRLLKARVHATSEGGVQAAMAVLDATERDFPASPEVAEMRGRLLLLSGDRGAAIAAFDRSLELEPQNRSLADYRRAQVAGRSLAQRHAVPIDEILNAAAPAAAGDNATVLFEQHVVKVFQSGLSSQFRQFVVRIETDRATQAFETVPFPFTPGEDRVEVVEAEVIHPDGSRSRPRAVGDHHPGKSSGVYTLGALRLVRFPTLAPGDVVHVQIRRDETGRRNLFGDFFGVFLPVQGEFAKQRVEIRIDAPVSRALYAHGEGLPVPARTTSEDGGQQQLTWSLTQVPAVIVEPEMPGFGDVASYINVSTFASWRALADWYRALVTPQLVLSPELMQLTRDLVADASDVRGKVTAIHSWVVKNTRYVGIEFGIHGFKPYRVTDIVKRGYGDCKDKTSLLLAMLNEVGVEAEFVLTRTRNLGSIAEAPATLWAFNHAIAYVPSLDLYLDGTSEFAGLGELPELDQGARVLRVDVYSDDPGDPVLTHIPYATPASNRVRSTSTVTVKATGDADITIHESVAGSEAPPLRQMLQDASQRDRLIEGILARQHAGATLTSARFGNLDVLGQPVTFDVVAHLPAFARRAGDALDVPITLEAGRLRDEYGAFGVRRQPLVLDVPSAEVEVSTYVLPAGASVDTLPQAIVLETPFGRFEQRFDTAPGGFRVESTLERRVARVAPGDYPAFRAFLDAIAAAEAMTVRATLGPGLTP